MLPSIKVVEEGFTFCGADGIILITDESSLERKTDTLSSVVNKFKRLDHAVFSNVSVIPIDVPAGRIIFSPISNVTDYDDVRIYSEAAFKGVKRAIQAGTKTPLLILPKSRRFPFSELVTLLGAFEALYVPLQLREDLPKKRNKLIELYISGENTEELEYIVELASVLESGRIAARDIGGGDPERMAPPRIAEYVAGLFKNTKVKVEIISDRRIFERDYPLFAAVDRAASVIDRHQGRIIFLRYEPEGDIQKSLGIVGKGITYDTGGADVKINGAMTGMSRDKCGAAAVAGFMKVVSLVKPKGIRIYGAMCIARNSIGENAYVSDEVIIARSRARVRIENTDAEGRMVMGDVLCKLKEDLMNYPNIHLMTIATLTGHAALSYGPYSIVMDNSVAREKGIGQKLQTAGEALADPFEISLLRREDMVFHKGKGEGDDVHQSGKGPSVRTCRGHQGPAGFLMLASGLDRHELSAVKPMAYSHLDIAGSAGEFPLEPTGSPILALSAVFIKELNLELEYD